MPSKPKSFWWFDYNHRVYQDDDGNRTSTMNERLAWRELAVVDETSRSWVLSNGVKIAKNKPLPLGYAASAEEVNRRVWKNRHQIKIAEAVKKLDVDTLKKVAALIGYEA